MSKLSFEEFKKQIERLQAAWEYGNAVYKENRKLEAAGICTDFLGDSYVCFNDDVVTLLENMFDDENKWIGYFCYELEFGTKWKPDMISGENGEDISLATVEDLWNNFISKDNPAACRERAPEGVCGPQCVYQPICGMCGKFGSLKPVENGKKCTDFAAILP